MNQSRPKWTDDELFRVREQVLEQWPTGRDVDLDDPLDTHVRSSSNTLSVLGSLTSIQMTFPKAR